MLKAEEEAEEEAGEVAAATSEPSRFLMYGVKPVDKTGRLPDWCEDDEDEGDDAGLETLLAADRTVEAAADASVVAEMT